MSSKVIEQLKEKMGQSVEALKREVDLFTSHIKEVSRDQSKLFS
jgi:hypothetical protein